MYKWQRGQWSQIPVVVDESNESQRGEWQLPPTVKRNVEISSLAPSPS
jgi:hypothetical protein